VCGAKFTSRQQHTTPHSTFCNTQGLQVRGRRQIQGRVDVCHHNTLQPTATHCVTMQHNATHCNPLQHTATHRVYKFVGGAKFKGEWKYGKMDGYGVYENLGILYICRAREREREKERRRKTERDMCIYMSIKVVPKCFSKIRRCPV